MPEWMHPQQLLAATVYSVLGTLLFAVLFWLFEWLTPFSMKHEIIEEHNTSLGIVIAGCAVALGMIVAAAISG